jgi:hypothetical protein
VAHDGTPIVDGVINDDAGNGLYLPVAFGNGEDVSFDEQSRKEAFVPQVDVTRQLYNPISYLKAKRRNAQILYNKGLGDKHRHYEIKSVSHFDAGMAGEPESIDFLDLGGFMDAMIVLIGEWVEESETPTPSKADVPGSEAAVALPEVAYPVGIPHHRPHVRSRGQATRGSPTASAPPRTAESAPPQGCSC